MYSARQFGIKDMELKTVRNKRHGAEDSSGQEYRMDGWLHEVVGGLRPTWSL